MKIQSSSIGMESSRVYTSVRMDAFLSSQSSVGIGGDFLSSLKSNLGNEDETKEAEGEKKTPQDESNDSLEFLKGKFNELSSIRGVKQSGLNDDFINRFHSLCIKYLLMLLLGKDAQDLFNVTYGMNGSNDYVLTTTTNTMAHYYAEEESTSYKASGKVVTSDGREIDFGIELGMSRSFEEYLEQSTEFTTISRNLMDPLVINMDTNVTEISDQKFYFDLNSDGIEDEMYAISKGSGFLALDKNNDGLINDGNELFGTASGDGFKDLSQYDKDHNGWIDENDDIFDKLKIMVINDDGSQKLFTLKEKGVGAIYLGNTDTQFSLTDSNNSTNAMIRKTGLFLYENGAAGTVQHLDLAVELGA